jgi:hypothetical protein
MGSLRSFERLNQYLKASPERVFFRFTNTLREEPLSQYELKISRGEAEVHYNTTPFGIYAFPFKYFFFNNSVESLSDFFYLLSKGVVKEKIKRGYVLPTLPSTSLAELGKGAALFAEDYRYIRFLVISPEAKVWILGKNDPWIDGSKALNLYREFLGMDDLPPIYEIIPLSVKKLVPLGPFATFPYLIGKLFLSSVYSDEGLGRGFRIRRKLYDAFEDILVLAFKNPEHYLNNLEKALNEVFLSKEVKDYEFHSFTEWIKHSERKERSGSYYVGNRDVRVQFILPLTSYIASFYLSLDRIFGDSKNDHSRLGDVLFIGYDLERILYDYKESTINLFLSLGYHRFLDLAKEIQNLTEGEAKEKFFKVRKEVVSNVIKMALIHSNKQVLHIRRLISSLLNELFSGYAEEDPDPSKIISLSLYSGFGKGHISEMMKKIPIYIFGFYVTTNPFSVQNIYALEKRMMSKMEERFIRKLSGKSYSSEPSYLSMHESIVKRLRNNAYSTTRYRDIILKLGFQVVVDRGYGLIHPNEPVQAVILDDSVLEYEDYFENFPYIYWRTLEELMATRFDMSLKKYWFKGYPSNYNVKSMVTGLIKSIERSRQRYSKEKVLSTIINLYLDFSFVSKLLSSLGFGKEDQIKFKKELAHEMKKIAKEMDPKTVKKIMSKSILYFVLDKKRFPPEKMKKAFQEIKKVLSTVSK